MVDIGILSVTDTLGEALVDKVMLVASGGSTLHINVGFDKDLRDIAMDVEVCLKSLIQLGDVPTPQMLTNVIWITVCAFRNGVDRILYCFSTHFAMTCAEYSVY